MINPHHLLAVARDVAMLDRRRPRQASLRRAISTAYYALFHLLIRSAVKAHVGFGPTHTHREIGNTVARWFSHTQMAHVCGVFAGPTVPSKLRKMLPRASSVVAVSAALQTVARTFRELQDARHAADYDPQMHYIRQDALDQVTLVERAFAAWEVAGPDPFRPIFLLLLLTGDSLIKDR